MRVGESRCCQSDYCVSIGTWYLEDEEKELQQRRKSIYVRWRQAERGKTRRNDASRMFACTDCAWRLKHFFYVGEDTAEDTAVWRRPGPMAVRVHLKAKACAENAPVQTWFGLHHPADMHAFFISDRSSAQLVCSALKHRFKTPPRQVLNSTSTGSGSRYYIWWPLLGHLHLFIDIGSQIVALGGLDITRAEPI